MDENSSSCSVSLQEAEESFNILLGQEHLDRRLEEMESIKGPFEEALDFALDEAYQGNGDAPEAGLFLQRILYRINRLKLFWYDDLENYKNETSVYLASIRSRIESRWQEWERSHLDEQAVRKLSFEEALHERVERDLNPSPNETGLYFRNDMTAAGYRLLLKIGSLDGLVEASQLSRVLGGVGNEVQSMLTRIFLEEYGGGRLQKKHSSFFKTMLEEMELDPKPEAYLDLAPWEVLANINFSFILSEQKRNFLRYVGALLYTEISVPASFENYFEAGQRLGLGSAAVGYWEVHIREDQRHGQWMVNDVALPLAELYGENAWEIIWGYDQQRFFSSRAGQAVVQCLREETAI